MKSNADTKQQSAVGSVTVYNSFVEYQNQMEPLCLILIPQSLNLMDFEFEVILNILVNTIIYITIQSEGNVSFYKNFIIVLIMRVCELD